MVTIYTYLPNIFLIIGRTVNNFIHWPFHKNPKRYEHLLSTIAISSLQHFEMRMLLLKLLSQAIVLMKQLMYLEVIITVIQLAMNTNNFEPSSCSSNDLIRVAFFLFTNITKASWWPWVYRLTESTSININ